MTETKEHDLVLAIIEQAKNNKNIEFKYITSWREFRYYTKLSRSTKLIIKTLKTSAKRLFKEYCKDIVAGATDVNKLLAYSQLLDMITFYSDNHRVLTEMVNEYDNYLGNHFWYSFFGGERDTWNIQ